MTAHDSSRRRLLRSLAVAITAPELWGLGPTASGAADEGRMPDLNGAVAWLNSAPLSSTALHGKVVLVNFWTYSCINSLRELPYMNELSAFISVYRRPDLVFQQPAGPGIKDDEIPAEIDFTKVLLTCTIPQRKSISACFY